jgi:hypothetical protein
LLVPKSGAQRASSTWSVRLTVLTIAFALVAFAGMTNPMPTAAASGVKVAIIVGPAGSSTAKYISNAERYAAQARSYGATVVEVYSPNATWPKVKAAAQGANILIYLGHGNGSPSPYGAFSKYRKDGFGLNATAGHGNTNTKYWGEYYIYTQIRFAPGAVIILNRLCYASGNSEWGSANPKLSVAKQRVDNYATGFLRAGARAVFAEGITNASYILTGLFTTNKTIGQIFAGSSEMNNGHDIQFRSKRNPAYRAWMAPKSAGRYYRSVVGLFDLNAKVVRSS